MSLQQKSYDEFSCKLVITLSGLSLKWMLQNQTCNLVLSKHATNGKMFQSQLPFKYMKYMLPCYSFERCSNSAKDCFIIVCDSGEIFVAVLEKGGRSSHLVQSQGNVVWANFVGDRIVIIQRCGKLLVGILDEIKQSIFWRSVYISLNPICCSNLMDTIVMSDGYSSYMLELPKNYKELSKANIERLPYCAVIGMRKKNQEILFHTCDVREYRVSLEALKENARKNNNNNTPKPLFIHHLDLSSTMKSIARLSDRSKSEKDSLNEINLYLEQISIAQKLITESTVKSVFNVKLLASDSSHKESGYQLSIFITQALLDFRFQGSWWQLNVKLKDCDHLNLVYDNLDFRNFYATKTVEISLNIPYKFVQNLILDYDNIAVVEFILVFSQFSLKKSLCSFKVHREHLDVLYFLCQTRRLDLPPLFKNCFIDKVSSIVGAFKKPEKTTVIEERASNHRTFVKIREKFISVLRVFFPDISANINSVISLTRWLHDFPILISCGKVDDRYYKITFEGPSRLVVEGVKYALEKRVLRAILEDTPGTESTLPLSPDLYSKAHLVKLILELETSESNISKQTLKRIHESLHDLVCNIPL